MQGVDDELRGRVRQKQAGSVLRATGTRLLEATQSIVVVGGLVIVVALQIPWLNDQLTEIGLSGTAKIVDSLVIFVLAAVFLEVRALARKVVEPEPLGLHLRDPMDVYPILLRRAGEIVRSDEKRLDVIGMTLYTAWPSINFRLSRPEFRGWTVRMAAAASVTGTAAAMVPAEWVPEAQRFLSEIENASQRADLRAQKVVLEAYTYDFVPALHGYRLGNGDLFYSILKWDRSGAISRDGFTYEYVPAEDRSASAEAIRAVFDSWLVRACATRWRDGTGSQS